LWNPDYILFHFLQFVFDFLGGGEMVSHQHFNCLKEQRSSLLCRWKLQRMKSIAPDNCFQANMKAVAINLDHESCNLDKGVADFQAFS